MAKLPNWSKLKPYKSDQRKSFEELCYQLAFEEYKEKGIFTSIDDSGGGDGVEFYLTLPNGDIWGWQAKYVDRFNSSQKSQVKESLQKAYEVHGRNLKKWFLCSKNNLTPKKGKKMGEENWFKESLEISKHKRKLVLPRDHQVKLEHWGDSIILNLLRKHPEIQKYFFSDTVLLWPWFENRYKLDEKTSEIGAKYENKLHIENETDEKVVKLLKGSELALLLEREMKSNQVEVYVDAYESACSELSASKVEDEYRAMQSIFIDLVKDKVGILRLGLKKLNLLKKALLGKDPQELELKIKDFKKYLADLQSYHDAYEALTRSKICTEIHHIQNGDSVEESYDERYKPEKISLLKNTFSKIRNLFLKKHTKIPPKSILNSSEEEITSENKKRSKIRSILFGPLHGLRAYGIQSLEVSFRVFELVEENVLHITGAAGMGKTHLAFNIFEKQIKKGKPALFIFGKNLDSNESLQYQIHSLLDIPKDWSLDDFLGALNVAGSTYGTKIPIIIDGLNESVYWQKLWDKGLEKLILNIEQNYRNLALITTYRHSYEDQLFPKKYFNTTEGWKKRAFLDGFQELTSVAISKYLRFYKITLTEYSSAINEFSHPLYLKLFCETKRGKTVSFQHEDLFDVFDEYIEFCQESIGKTLSLEGKYEKEFVKEKLNALAAYLWENNTNAAPMSAKLFTAKELTAFEGENLLIFRDWKSTEEKIGFTYDFLGGYITSKYLLNQNKLAKKNLLDTLLKREISRSDLVVRFIKSKEFKRKLLNEMKQHPLYHDILRSFCIQLIKEEQIFIHEIIDEERINKYAIKSFFEVKGDALKMKEKSIKKLIEKEFFKSHPRDYLFNLFEKRFNTKHPLNYLFLSDLLLGLEMPERDLSWSEYLREKEGERRGVTEYIENFTEACINSEELTEKIHVAARKTMWILTSSSHNLRDKATKGLYFYARRYPKEFLDLLKYSLKINDPYVPERMLASCYGLAMAKAHSEQEYQKDQLPSYANLLFDSYFKKNAPFGTTHLLTRDYAKRTIDLCLKYHPTLLTKQEKVLITYPLKSYKHINWGEKEKGNLTPYGKGPIHMDFANYTIGRLIKGRRNYDDSNEDYKTLLANIYWRVFNLGYSVEKFKKADELIANIDKYHSTYDERGKIDRYGKKYSWIAFYEMLGQRTDMELAKDWEGNNEFRVSSVDLDPSFPTMLKDYNLVGKLGGDNFLGEKTEDQKKWCNDKKRLEAKKYICVSNLWDKTKKEWILMKGIIGQKDADDQERDVHIALNVLLIGEKDWQLAKKVFEKHKDCQFEYINALEDYYIYEGEVPWSELLPNDYTCKYTIRYNFRNIEKERSEMEILNHGKKLTQSESDELDKKVNEYDSELFNKLFKQKRGGATLNLADLVSKSRSGGISETKVNIAKREGYEIKEHLIKYSIEECDALTIKAHKTIFESAWESYHNEINPSGTTVVPSTEICNFLELHLKPQSSDIYTKNGELAATSFKKGESYDDKELFTYMRKDLLETYLKAKKLKPIWFQWSEKRYFQGGVKEFVHGQKERIMEVDYRAYFES